MIDIHSGLTVDNFTIPPKSDKYGLWNLAINEGKIIHINSQVISNAICHFKRRYNRQYIVRKIDKGSCRVWRIK